MKEERISPAAFRENSRVELVVQQLRVKKELLRKDIPQLVLKSNSDEAGGSQTK